MIRTCIIVLMVVLSMINEAHANIPEGRYTLRYAGYDDRRPGDLPSCGARRRLARDVYRIKYYNGRVTSGSTEWHIADVGHRYLLIKKSGAGGAVRYIMFIEYWGRGRVTGRLVLIGRLTGGGSRGGLCGDRIHLRGAS